MLLPLLLPVLVAASFSVDDSQHFAIRYTSDPFPSHLVVDEKDTVRIASVDAENYVCHIARPVDEQSSSRVTGYTGPSPIELLAPLTTDKVCSIRMEPYWSYELCHGRYLLQFHEEKDLARGSQRAEYYLGNYHVDYVTVANKLDQIDPPRRMVDDLELPYFPIQYTQGTTCDITGKPRTTTVIYVCVQHARNQIHSISETSSCNYEVVVLTNTLCSHPAFKPSTKQTSEIVCYDQATREEPSPLREQQAKKEKEDEFKRQYTIGNMPEKFSQIDMKVSEMLENGFKELENKMRAAQGGNTKSVEETIREKKQRTNQEIADSKKKRAQLAMMQETVRAIFSGEECIHGGAGWWKYEYCYGSKVTQYHQDGTNRLSVKLGEWNADIQRAWIKENPHKKPHKFEGKVTQISHIFTYGDFCEEANGHRSVEVRMRCKLVDGSKLAVAMTMMEPSTCSYILTVESDRFCAPMQFADGDGIIQITQEQLRKLF